MQTKVPFLFKSLTQATRQASTKQTKYYSPSNPPVDPMIITVALTGNMPTREMNPNVPLTAEDISSNIQECYEAGARVFHIHARGPDLKPTPELNAFRRIAKLAKEKCPDAILQLSTGGRSGGTLPHQRWDIIRLCPEMGSFCTGSNNLAKIIYMNSPEFVNQLAQIYKDCGVKPEIECFDHAHIDNAIFLMNIGLLDAPVHFNFVTNTAGGIAGTVKNICHMRDSIPVGSTFSVCGIGKKQASIVAATIAMGGYYFAF
jgi:3-keto-5-aminohexanoate cleavage enzyme